MDKLRMELLARNINPENLTDDQVIGMAKVFGLQVPRKVVIEDYTSKSGKKAKYVKTENFTIPGKDAEHPSAARNLFLRVEALDQAIADLLVAKGMIEAMKK